jgi:hypothetical protein
MYEGSGVTFLNVLLGEGFALQCTSWLVLKFGRGFGAKLDSDYSRVVGLCQFFLFVHALREWCRR